MLIDAQTWRAGARAERTCGTRTQTAMVFSQLIKLTALTWQPSLIISFKHLLRSICLLSAPAQQQGEEEKRRQKKAKAQKMRDRSSFLFDMGLLNPTHSTLLAHQCSLCCRTSSLSFYVQSLSREKCTVYARHRQLSLGAIILIPWKKLPTNKWRQKHFCSQITASNLITKCEAVIWSSDNYVVCITAAVSQERRLGSDANCLERTRFPAN